MHIDDELVCQVVSLVVAKERSLAASVDLFCALLSARIGGRAKRGGGDRIDPRIGTCIVPALRIRTASKLPVGFI